MKAETYEVELLTPCFCAGADQARAEIRAPSIRGELRWWFRALGGTREQEKAVFGGVHRLEGERKEDAARASAVTVQIPNAPHSDRKATMNELGLSPDGNYLIWPLRQPQSARGVLPAGTRFEIRISWRRDVDASLTVLFGRALRAWMLMGSMGTRSRRGWGSIWPGVNGPEIPKSQEELSKELDALSLPADVKVISISSPQQSYADALNAAGLWLKQWRAGSTKSVQYVLEWGLSDHDATLGRGGTVTYRQAIGLPLSQRYSDGARYESSLDKNDRWASPVQIKVVRFNKELVPIATFWPSMAPPEGSTISVADRRARQSRELTLDHGLLLAMMHPPEGGSVVR